ncbi:MAG: hypothetical protein LBG87_06855, partial [Spirochaetaceae bacterium]|nr:hypothetical protein [Spirochaetaceae bacterium]
MKKIGLFALPVLVFGLLGCASTKRDAQYSALAKEKSFDELFPKSAFYRTFPSIDEAYEYVNIASAKFGQSVGNKRRDKGLGAKLIGPPVPTGPVTVVCYMYAGTGGVSGNIELSEIDKPLETVIREANTDALLIFMVFTNDKAAALQTYYLDPKYSGYSNGNAQIKTFGVFDNTYEADYPIGWGIEKAFQYLQEGSELNKNPQNRIASSSASNSVGSGNGNRVKALRSPAERNDPSKTEEERIAGAIAWGDCAYLYAYTQGADADPKLAAQAAAGIKRYAGMDSGVGKYLNDKMEPQVRKVPKDLTEKVFTEPAKTLPGV